MKGQGVTWNDGHVDANIPAILYKLQEDLHIIEQLCHNDLASSIDLQSKINANESGHIMSPTKLPQNPVGSTKWSQALS